MFAAPSKKLMIFMMLRTIYPFLSKYLKFGFSQPGAEKFFIELMDKAMKHRITSNIQRVDYLDHLLTLKKKKEISGEVFNFISFQIALLFQLI